MIEQEPRCYTIHVAGVPPGINTSMHYMERYRAWKGFRDAVGWQARALVNQSGGHRPFAQARVLAVVHVRSPRHFYDADNIMSVVKPLVDALKGIVIEDDSPRHIALAVHQDIGKERGVTLEIQEVRDGHGG